MRDYQKENEWRNSKYTIVKAYIDKELGQNFKDKLKKNNESISGWLREKAIEYLKD